VTTPSRNPSGAVLDASAVLAYLKRESGYDSVRQALDAGAAISTVNLAEVYAKVVTAGQQLDAVAVRLVALGLRPLPFTEDDARASATMYPTTRTLGLSLGDRACLALGQRLRLPVLTADRAWTRLTTGFDIRVIR
jgi:ribonuclease VapC